MNDDWDIPVKVKRRSRFTSYGWNNLIIASCFVVFILKLLMDLVGLSIIYKTPFGLLRINPIDYFLAFIPANVLIMPWQIITSIFVHAEFWHLFINMFVLFFFGSELERRIGNNYLKVFFASGLAGSLAYLVYAYLTNPYIPAMGASAAIFGVMGALAVIAPEIRVFIFPFPIPISIRVAIILFALYDLIFLPFSYKTGVAHIAHLAGLVVGIYLGRLYRIRRVYSYGYYY